MKCSHCGQIIRGYEYMFADCVICSDCYKKTVEVVRG